MTTTICTASFLSTLSLRRATPLIFSVQPRKTISIHALLAESDLVQIIISGYARISIHALLAESDRRPGQTAKANKDFYPRSPCGERRDQGASNQLGRQISIHALLAESDKSDKNDFYKNWLFLSTLSLRRATVQIIVIVMHTLISIHALLAESDSIIDIINNVIDHFYPRSPCGERRWLRCWQLAARDISIHALLAESDVR